MKSKSKKILGYAVLLVGLTLSSVGVWLLLSPAQYQAIVRIQVGQPYTNDADAPVSYDPYFIQTEFEKIQSQLVLSEVVGALNLNEEWGNRYNHGRTLETNETIKMLQRRMKFVPDQNLGTFEIHVTTENADQAAKIANAIASTYRDQRIERLRYEKAEDLETMEEAYQMEEKKITREQSSLEGMKKQLNLTNIEPAGEALKSNYPAYYRGKQELANDETFQELVKNKIESEKSSLNQPIDPFVNIVSPAGPPKSPTGPNRTLGTILMLCGLPISGFGISILKKP